MFDLWSQYFYITTLDNKDEILTEWSEYISNPSFFGEAWSMSKTQTSIRSEKNDQLPWDIWFKSVQPHMSQFLDSLNPRVPYTVHCDEMWMNSYKKGDYQEPHDHAFPGRSVSAIYVLDFPEDEKDPGGTLVFECPNFNVIRSSGLDRIFDAYNYQHITPPLEKGTLILFPSWISHYVLPNKTDKRRATIAANFVVRQEQHDE